MYLLANFLRGNGDKSQATEVRQAWIQELASWLCERVIHLRHFWLALVLLLASWFVTGCALHYYDTETGTEHIWGIGHMKMKATKPDEGLQAVIHGTDIVGVSLGKADKHGYFTVGWNRLQYIDVLKESTSIRLEWPDNSFFNVRVGSEFPLDPIFSLGTPPEGTDSKSTKNKESHP